MLLSDGAEVDAVVGDRWDEKSWRLFRGGTSQRVPLGELDGEEERRTHLRPGAAAKTASWFSCWRARWALQKTRAWSRACSSDSESPAEGPGCADWAHAAGLRSIW